MAIQEDGAEKTNLLHRISDLSANIEPIANIKWVQNKQKDDASENIAQTRTDEPAESYKELS
jgi:CO dehydrogenase nickel-insertion accessory protein CooC1